MSGFRSSSSLESPRSLPLDKLSLVDKRRALVDLVVTLSPCELAAYHTDRLKRAFAPVLDGVPWSPSPRSLFSVLEAEVRTAVLVVQDAINPKYKLNEFTELGRSDYNALCVALDNIMSMLVSLSSSLRPRFANPSG